MSYYTNLINAWNGVTQPPTGVTGTGLSSNDTTAQKIAKVNAWTVVGPALTPNIPVSNIIASILSTDLLALTALQLQEMQFVLQGGSGDGTVYAPSGGTVRNVFASIFSGKATTLSNLTSLVAQYDSPAIGWCEASNGGALSSTAISLTDTNAAGLS